MTEDLIIRGIPIILNNDLSPHLMKERGYINSLGKEIIREVEVGAELYQRLKEMEENDYCNVWL